jgi:transcriptional regulator with XRE-family HTH domain
MNRLRDFRVSAGLNQYELANVAKVHQSRISLIENFYVTPTPSESERLGMALRCQPEEIFGPSAVLRSAGAGKRG